MKIKDFDELETKFNEAAWCLDKIDSLSKILLDCIQNLTLILNEEISDLKQRFNVLEQDLSI